MTLKFQISFLTIPFSLLFSVLLSIILSEQFASYYCSIIHRFTQENTSLELISFENGGPLPDEPRRFPVSTIDMYRNVHRVSFEKRFLCLALSLLTEKNESRRKRASRKWKISFPRAASLPVNNGPKWFPERYHVDRSGSDCSVTREVV